MIRRAVAWGVWLALAAIAFGAGRDPQRYFSPGPLHGVHAPIAAHCFACHAPWRGATAARCIACHAPADIGVRRSDGQPVAAASQRTRFHQQLIEQDCLACHREHHGEQSAGRSRRPFAHALLRPETRGRCEACHRPPGDALHRQALGGCGQCHDPQRWRPARFDHRELFVLEGEHDAPCATCHAGNDFSRYTCYGCHEHRPERVRAQHAEEGIGLSPDCAACHRSAHQETGARGRGVDDD